MLYLYGTVFAGVHIPPSSLGPPCIFFVFSQGNKGEQELSLFAGFLWSNDNGGFSGGILQKGAGGGGKPGHHTLIVLVFTVTFPASCQAASSR